MPFRNASTVSSGHQPGNRRHRLPLFIALTDDDRDINGTDLIAGLNPGDRLIIRRRDHRAAVREIEALWDLAANAGISLSLSVQNKNEAISGVGVHIPEREAGLWRHGMHARRGIPFISTSAHGIAGLRQAAKIGADVVLLSPVFATASHLNAACLGSFRFNALAAASQVPVFALGGVHWPQVAGLLNIGASGIAGIGLFAHKR